MSENKKAIVTQHNDLIEASYKLAVNELKIIRLCMSRVNTNDISTAMKVFEITANEFAETYNIDIKSAYEALKEGTCRIFERAIIRVGKTWVEKFRWVERIFYCNYEGKVQLTFSTSLIPYISQIKERFTSYQLDNIINLKSIYSIRLYEWLMQFKNTGKLIIEIEKFKERLDIKNEYERFGNFKTWVVKIAVKELQEKSNMNINYKFIREGRKYKKIEFTFTDKTEKTNIINSGIKNSRKNYKKTEGQRPLPKEYKGLAPTAPEPSPLAKEYIEKNQIKLPLNKITGI